ncbi:MAG: hypothetical protein MZV70_64380 [Desulfobacterales bacterium]|nr:hypothetical protein [Desulfobacterales bacterium]
MEVVADACSSRTLREQADRPRALPPVRARRSPASRSLLFELLKVGRRAAVQGDPENRQIARHAAERAPEAPPEPGHLPDGPQESEMTTPPRVLVIGAGIGGLTAAGRPGAIAALEVDLVERATGCSAATPPVWPARRPTAASGAAPAS